MFTIIDFFDLSRTLIGAKIDLKEHMRMRKLFDMDIKDYNPNGKSFVRPSVRGIVLKGSRIALVYSQKYDYYKFPGGGIEDNENQIETLVREVCEESGLIVLKDSIKEYGYVRRMQKSNRSKEYEIFIQDNYYYFCDVEDKMVAQKLDYYEKEEGFTLKWVYPSDAIYVNRNHNHGPKDELMIQREAKVLELLIKEDCFK